MVKKQPEREAQGTSVPRQTHVSGWVLPVMLIVAVLLFRFFWVFSPWLVPSSILGGAPSVADKIAAASALFSMLAFVGLLYTILLQRKELKAQRENQESVREEVSEQRRYLKAQADALTQQAFENTFFHLLRLHNDNVRSQTWAVPGSSEVLTGRAAFTAAAAALTSRVAEHHRTFDSEMSLEELNRSYSEVCERRGADFGHYFRNLYHIVKYVDENDVANKRRYTAQVRAQLSQAEFELLFFNGLRRAGKSKLKPIIERYALLHEIRLSDDMTNLAENYVPTAFGLPDRA